MPTVRRRFTAAVKNERSPQSAFFLSDAKIVGYGGAMGGGKSRALCESGLRDAIKHPGLITLVCRQAHTAIENTTKKTMLEQVLPPELKDPALGARKVESGGKDFIQLPNGSRFHFIGLDDPIRWYSAEVGLLLFDEAHEIAEKDVLELRTRLRQACRDCAANPTFDEAGEPVPCEHMPQKIRIAFNPENPGHWLQHWFIKGATQTEYGFRKDRLIPVEGDRSLGACEFIFARAIDNPYLSAEYIEENLGGLPSLMRRRLLEGEWLFTSGSQFFDHDALHAYQQRVKPPKWVCVSAGADERLRKRLLESGTDPGKGKIVFRPAKDGKWAVWATPVRERTEGGKRLPAHRYVVTVDVSSGGSADWSAIQVLDLEAFEQVAEFQDMIDPDLLAVEAYRAGRVFNNAVVAPEITGGWGLTIATELQRLHYPAIYTRRILDRRTKRWTDKLGWDTTTSTRPMMLDTLERVLREEELELHGERTLAELQTFVRGRKRGQTADTGKPEAQPGTTDDLVITLAMAVTLREQLPRQLRRPMEKRREPVLAATGWGA
jgi:phage terminase large subunit